MTYMFVGMEMAAFLEREHAGHRCRDLGMLMTSRNQAQNAAAGPLAGATALFCDDYANRTASGPAVTNAINIAHAGRRSAQGDRGRASVLRRRRPFP